MTKQKKGGNMTTDNKEKSVIDTPETNLIDENTKKESVFNELGAIKIKEKTKKKGKYDYIPWADAWGVVLKKYPNTDFEILRDSEGRIYFGDDEIGYWVETKITIEEKSRSMILPILDYSNNTIKCLNIEHVNKAIMRCLVKNLALMGYGLKLYANEEIFSDSEKQVIDKIYITKEQVKEVKDLIKKTGADEARFLNMRKVERVEEIAHGDFESVKADFNKKEAMRRREEKKKKKEQEQKQINEGKNENS